MKRMMITLLIGILAISVFATTIAMAASISGSVWTGKPTIFGIGYYCTAARNDSGGDTSTHWAWARTYYNGTSKYAKKTGNVRAVASSGSVHPTSGEGQYGEPGYSSKIAKFKSTAWD